MFYLGCALYIKCFWRKTRPVNGKRLGLERETPKFGHPEVNAPMRPQDAAEFMTLWGGRRGGGSRLTCAGDQEFDENENFFQAATWLVSNILQFASHFLEFHMWETEGVHLERHSQVIIPTLLELQSSKKLHGHDTTGWRSKATLSKDPYQLRSTNWYKWDETRVLYKPRLKIWLLANLLSWSFSRGYMSWPENLICPGSQKVSSSGSPRWKHDRLVVLVAWIMSSLILWMLFFIIGQIGQNWISSKALRWRSLINEHFFLHHFDRIFAERKSQKLGTHIKFLHLGKKINKL